MFYCRFCGAALPDDARFCHLCGREVERAPRCPRCGASLPEGSRFCSYCGAALESAPPQQEAPRPRGAQQGRPPEIPLGGGRTIRIPAPEKAAPAAYQPVAAPAGAPLDGVRVPAVCNPHPFSGSVQRFFGADGSFYTFRGTGMYGFLEPFSMNYAGGQGPIEKGGGQWFFHSVTGAPEQEVEALRGVQILSSAPEGMYFYRAPTIYFADREGRVYPFMEAAETLTDLLCWRSWLFVTYLGPFEEHTEKNGAAAYRDRSYVVVYDRASGGAAAILERCAGVFYIDENVAVLCDLLDGGEIRRNVYKVPVRGWTEEGLKALANYGGRIRGSTAFSRLLFDACGADNHWKNTAECTADLRCCDWKRKRLGYQKKGVLIWRAFSGAPLSGGDPL